MPVRELLKGAFALEARDADVADVLAFHARADVADRNDLTNDGHLDRLLDSLAIDLETDRGVHRSTHLLDGLLERQTLHRLIVEMRDQIVRLNARAMGGGAVHRANDLHETVFHRDLDAEPAELAARLRLHVTEILDVEESRVRIERGQHPVDRRSTIFDSSGFSTYCARTCSNTSPNRLSCR